MKKSLLFLSFLFLISCNRYAGRDPSKDLVSLTLSHQNGFSECINSKERLKNFQEVDFLQPQPYQKIACFFNAGKDGKAKAFLASYYPSGQVKQYLEVVDNRAFGKYKEWHSNGRLKLDADVVGGMADLSLTSEKSWVFNGKSRAWDEEGRILAEIPYVKGSLEGESKYFDADGYVAKVEPYFRGLLEGDVIVYNEKGEIVEHAHYHKGILDGPSETFWVKGSIKASELYAMGLLSQGAYFNANHEQVATIVDGHGTKALFKDKLVQALKTFHDGKENGLIQIFGEDGKLKKEYTIAGGFKNGEEIIYSGSNRKLVSLHYKNGLIQGLAKTWYENGILESQREMFQNKKNGELRAWYGDGRLMLIEEYQLDHLVNGQYFKKGETKPISRVIHGKGLATLFDAEGNFLRKVIYNDGKAES